MVVISLIFICIPLINNNVEQKKMNAHIKNDLKLRKLTLYIKAIEKEQIRPKDTRNKEMMKIKAEINEMENRKKQKSWCFEMNNKIDKV